MYNTSVLIPRTLHTCLLNLSYKITVEIGTFIFNSVESRVLKNKSVVTESYVTDSTTNMCLDGTFLIQHK